MKVGDWNVEVVPQGQSLRLKVAGRTYGLETLVSAEDLLDLSAYLSREIEKVLKTREGI